MVNLSIIRNDFYQAQSRWQNAATRGKQMLQRPFSYGAPPPPYYPYPQHFVPPPPQFYAPPPPPPAFYNRPGKPPAPRRYTPAFGTPPPGWYVVTKGPCLGMLRRRVSFGAKKRVYAPRSSGTHSTFKKARTTTVNGTKRVLYKKIKVRGHKPRCIASASYKPFMTTRQGQTLYLRHSKKVTGKLGGHRFGYDDESETPMYFGGYY